MVHRSLDVYFEFRQLKVAQPRLNRRRFSLVRWLIYLVSYEQTLPLIELSLERRDVFKVERGQGIGLNQQALMHRIRRKSRRYCIRSHDLGRNRQCEPFVSEPACAIFGREDLAHDAAWIGERCRNRVPAVEDRDAFADRRAHGLGLRGKAALVLRQASFSCAFMRMFWVPGFLGHAGDVSRSAFASKCRTNGD